MNGIQQMLQVRNSLASVCRNDQANAIECMDFPEAYGPIKEVLIKLIGQTLDTAYCESVYWRWDLWLMSQSGLDNWEGKESNCLKRPMNGEYSIDFWWLECPGVFKFPRPDGKYIPEWYLLAPDDWALQGFVIFKVPIGSDKKIYTLVFGVVFNVESDHPSPKLVSLSLQECDTPCNQITMSYVAACEFMQLPFVGREQLNHQSRKEAKRKGQEVTSASAIILRREPSEREEPVEAIGVSSREYHCQWFRSGHWRRLHEPRKVDGADVTYVRPALCGPEDKPLKDRIIKVVR